MGTSRNKTFKAKATNRGRRAPVKHGIKLIAKSGGNAVMLGLFWTGAVLIGSSIAINYVVNNGKFENKNQEDYVRLRNLV